MVTNLNGRWGMSWESLMPLALLAAFLILWWVVLPRLGVRT